MLRLPPRSTRTDTLCPNTTLVRSEPPALSACANAAAARGPGDRVQARRKHRQGGAHRDAARTDRTRTRGVGCRWGAPRRLTPWPAGCCLRSEEHTSELPSLLRISYAVFRLNKNNVESLSRAR